MVFCRGCGKEIHESAPACPQCGAPQNVAQAAAPAKEKVAYTSYDQVPWYRKNWFAIVCAFFFMPGLWFALFSGDIYYESKGQLKTYSKGAKIAILIWSVLVFINYVIQGMSGEKPA